MNATAVRIIENSGGGVEEKSKSRQVSIWASGEQEPVMTKHGLFLE